MKKTFYCLLLLISFSLFSFAADEAKFARYPAPSPDGSKIAFSYQGDIWIVPAEGGRAIRLTVHEGYDWKPIWSPDGSKIAFASDRFGSDDVFVINSEGGKATRLTFLSMGDVPTCWTLDGTGIIFNSNRDYSISGATRVPFIYVVPVTGGQPKEFSPEAGNEAALSPDGSLMAFVDHNRRDWDRIGYRGKSNNNIWLWNMKADTWTRLTDFMGVDAVPMWKGADTIYYLSEDGGIFNIWSMSVSGENKTKVTNHDDHIRFPAISYDGSLIAYELGLDLYTLDTETGETAKLNVIAPSDSKFNSYERKTLRSGASQFEVSPDGEEIAFIVRGEIFVMKEKGGDANQITETPYREMDVVWNKEGDTLYFSSDRDGQYDLYNVVSDDPDEKKLNKALSFKVTKMTDTPERETGADLSPDGTKLAYLVDEKKLYILDLESSESTLFLDGWNLQGFSWSPDSNWIAYAREDKDFNSDIWVKPVAGGDEVNVSRHPDNEYNPVWSDDGKRLAFLSRRIENNVDLWFVYLTQEDFEKTQEEWEEYYENPKKPVKKDEKAEDKKDGEEAKKEEAKEPEFVVKIDFEDIHERLTRVSNIQGTEYSLAISPDGKTYVFSSDNDGQADLYSIQWNGKDIKKLTNGGANPVNLRFSSKGDKVYFIRQGGSIESVSLADKMTAHGFSAHMIVDYPAERLQMYEEAWRTLNRLFYDENFHGADWPAVREKIRPYAVAAVAERDFSDAVNMIFGYLNGSHLGYYNFERNPNAEPSGTLGLRFDPGYEGPGLKVAEVLKNGPTDKVKSKVTPGQILMAIDGDPVSWSQNINELLLARIDDKVVLSIAENSEDEDFKRVIVRPASVREEFGLLYDRFVRNARKKTHELSNGRIGYLHVQAMMDDSLEKFERELYSEAHDKDAIVIDVRNNGGGWTTDMMLAILQVKDHATTSARGSDEWGYPQDRRPLYAWTKPIIVLCNEYSYSNAEIFSWSIKTLGRGKVVGMDTFGAVISTGGYGLINDTSFVRTPYRAWHVLDENKTNMELNGCPPDIIVEYLPGDTAKDIDRQLDTAVKELLSELNSK